MKCELEYNNERYPINCIEIIDRSLRTRDAVQPPIDQPDYVSRAGYVRKTKPITHAEPHAEDYRALSDAILKLRSEHYFFSSNDLLFIIDPEFAAILATLYEIEHIRKDAIYEFQRLQGFRKEYQIEIDRDEHNNPIFAGIPEKLYGIRVKIEA